MQFYYRQSKTSLYFSLSFAVSFSRSLSLSHSLNYRLNFSDVGSNVKFCTQQQQHERLVEFANSFVFIDALCYLFRISHDAIDSPRTNTNVQIHVNIEIYVQCAYSIWPVASGKWQVAGAYLTFKRHIELWTWFYTNRYTRTQFTRLHL